jgi:hypothetical protein
MSFIPSKNGGGNKKGHVAKPAVIAPNLRPETESGSVKVFKANEMFNGGNFKLFDFRLRLSKNGKVELETFYEFGKLQTGYKVARSPFVTLSFYDQNGLTLDEWKLPTFAKKCDHDEIRRYTDRTVVPVHFWSQTKELGARHTSWDFKYC